MDDELRQAFATLSAQMANVGADARNAADLSRETAYQMTKVSREVDGLKTDVSQLKGAVFGSNPPPAPLPPIAARITHSEGDIADLTGRVMAMGSELAVVKGLNEEQSVDIGTIKLTLAKNNDDTAAIKKALTGFVKEHPSLVAGLVSFITTALGVATAWLASKGH